MNRKQAEKVARIIRRRFDGVHAVLVWTGKVWWVRAWSDFDENGVFVTGPYRRHRKQAQTLMPILHIKKEVA